MEKKNEQQAEIQQRAGSAFKIVALISSSGDLEGVELLMEEARE